MLNRFVTAMAATLLVGLSSWVTAAETTVIIVSHEVKDFDGWKKIFDAGKQTRDKAGLKSRYILRDVDKPNMVTVVLESANAENARKFAAGLKDRIKKSDVIGEADIKVGTTASAAPRK